METLEKAINDYIKNNPGVDSVDIVSHFKLSADITLASLNVLLKQGKVVRQSSYGINDVYVCVARLFV